jgi:antitoxin Phd
MQSTWQLQEAKSKFSELVENATHNGPQFVTKRGIDSVVIISIEEYNKLKKPKNSLFQFFQNAPKVDLDINRNKDLGRNIEL